MKIFIIGLVFLSALFSGRAAQPRVMGVEVVQANSGSMTNPRTTGTNSLYGTASDYHALNVHNSDLAGNVWYNWSFADGGSMASNRWRIGVSAIGWTIYDMGTGRAALSIATAESSVGGSGAVDVNGVNISSNGAISSHSTSFLGGDTTVSNSLSLTGRASSINFDVRGLLGSAAYRQRFNFSNDMGQTYSWQVNVNTNQWCVQRQNTDADMPLMITRTGTKFGSLNATATNSGTLAINGGILTLGTNDGFGAMRLSNSPASSNTAIGQVGGVPFMYLDGLNSRVAIGTNTPAQPLDVIGGIRADYISQRFQTLLLFTNSTANTNLTLSWTNNGLHVSATNPTVSLTNILTAAGLEYAFIIDIGAQTFAQTLVLPSLGAASYGVYIRTNLTDPPITTALAANTGYRISGNVRATNINDLNVRGWK